MHKAERIKVIPVYRLGMIEINHQTMDTGTPITVWNKTRQQLIENKYMNILDKIKKGFGGLSLTEQRDILLEYAEYVNNYPDDHDESSYPACFWEWYSNDFEELKINL